MKLSKISFALCLNFLICNVKSAKILGVFPMPAHSHYTLGITLMKELVSRGHEVTFISAFQQKNPIKNLREVSLEKAIPENSDYKRTLFDLHQATFWRQNDYVMEMGIEHTKNILNLENVRNLLKEDKHFDLVIIENFVNDAFLGFGYHFNAPNILLAPGPMTYLSNYFVGNPSPSAYIPNISSRFGSNMNLIERIKNLYYDILGELLLNFKSIPGHNEILQSTFPGAPDIRQLIHNVSLILTTSHSSTHSPVPLLPSVKEIGGYHISKPKPLPKDLQRYLDDAKEGVVVFSMGSSLNASMLPNHVKESILRTFGKLQQKVLWKLETDLPGKPKNVKIVNWLPQTDVLAHPNVKLFISHGGILSVIEAVYHGVPILGIPVFWDQELNIKNAEQNGFALNLPFRDLNENTLFSCIQHILYTPDFEKNVKSRQAILLDQPLTPMDTAIYWIEHVIIYKGAEHLKSPALRLMWYEREMLDVYFYILLFFVGLCLVVKKCFRYLCSCKSKNNVVKVKKN
ncbi:unnamed protein product [Brassicogethes aeneus]|uniref:UDP-glucuronosyltransferase n=1 Tax=Brassicogethes aeneus TaxID=1431903 RepID=A0A9P0AL33_BRAAE|nr:unnamed protein product [Brassicogethes aeneus]